MSRKGDTSGIMTKQSSYPQKSLGCLSRSQHVFLIYFVSMLAMSVSGVGYAFGSWSTILKSQLHFTQPEIEKVGFLGNIGSYTGPIIGILVSILNPRYCALLAAISIFSGYGLMSLAVLNIDGFKWLQTSSMLGFLFLMCGFATGMMHSLGLTINVYNLPRHIIGAAISILVAIYGLSSFFYTAICVYVFDKNVGSYLLFLCISTSFVALLDVIVLQRLEHPTSNNENEKQKLITINIQRNGELDHESDAERQILYQSNNNNNNNNNNDNNNVQQSNRQRYSSGTDLQESNNEIQLNRQNQSNKSNKLNQTTNQQNINPHSQTPYSHSRSHYNRHGEPSPTEFDHNRNKTNNPFETITSSSDDVNESELLNPNTLIRPSSTRMQSDSSDNHNNQYTLSQLERHDSVRKQQAIAAKHDSVTANQQSIVKRVTSCLMLLLKSSTFWILSIAFVLISGPGLMTINNLGSFVKSLNNDEDDKHLFFKLMLLLSLANCAGRLFMSVSDFVYLRRALFLGLAALLTLIGNLMFLTLVSEKEHLYMPLCIAMIGYGCLWAILPILVSDLFGRKNFSMNFGFVTIMPAISTLIYNHLTGHWYDEAINDETRGQNPNDCVGTSCYQTIWITNCLSALFAILLCAILVPRTNGGKSIKELNSV